MGYGECPLCFRAFLPPTGSNDLSTQLLWGLCLRQSADTSGAAPDATWARGVAKSSRELSKSEALQASETNRVRLSKHGLAAVHRESRLLPHSCSRNTSAIGGR